MVTYSRGSHEQMNSWPQKRTAPTLLCLPFFGVDFCFPKSLMGLSNLLSLQSLKTSVLCLRLFLSVLFLMQGNHNLVAKMHKTRADPISILQPSLSLFNLAFIFFL